MLCMKNGDSYIPEALLKESFLKKTKEFEVDFDEVLDSCVLSRALINDDGCIYPKAQYDAETYIASFLAEFPYRTLEPCNDDEVKDALKNIQDSIGITYDETQIHAIHTLFDTPVSIMSGGPGTGKTTVVRAIVELLKRMYPNCIIECCAPTGRAAKRLSQLCETKSSTIHSLLQWNLESNEFKKNEKILYRI